MNTLKVIIFAMMNMGIHVAAQIFLTWTGFLHQGILVKKILLIGSFYNSIEFNTVAYN